MLVLVENPYRFFLVFSRRANSYGEETVGSTLPRSLKLVVPLSNFSKSSRLFLKLFTEGPCLFKPWGPLIGLKVECSTTRLSPARHIWSIGQVLSRRSVARFCRCTLVACTQQLLRQGASMLVKLPDLTLFGCLVLVCRPWAAGSSSLSPVLIWSSTTFRGKLSCLVDAQCCMWLMLSSSAFRFVLCLHFLTTPWHLLFDVELLCPLSCLARCLLHLRCCYVVSWLALVVGVRFVCWSTELGVACVVDLLCRK